MTSKPFAVFGDLLDFDDLPRWGEIQEDRAGGVRYRPDHWLMVAGNGRILGVQAEAPPEGFEQVDCRGQLVLPGFIDTHVHSVQMDVLASFGTELLDWLTRYTFPAELRHASPEHAQAQAQTFVQALLRHGTTSALVFPTRFAGSVDAVFEAARARNMRLLAGKVLMDREVPAGLQSSADELRADTEALVTRWHGQGRLAYALTPRFAITSTATQLEALGHIARADPTLYVQTHLAENQAEVAAVKALFPQARSYLDVYEGFGLLGPRSILAHGIWLDEADRSLLAARGSAVAHSPTSNLFLGSGLVDWRSLEASQVTVAVASDVGGGTSLNLWRNLAAAYQIQALRGEHLSAFTAVHAATRGAACALRLEQEIGSFNPGTLADFCVWNWQGGPVLGPRTALAATLHEKLFALMTLGDERQLSGVWVAGQRQAL